MKKVILIFVVTITLSCSKNEEKQNLDINVTGKVTNQNNTCVGDVTIYIQRWKTGNYVATVYEQYQTVITNSSGNYSYLVKNDTYNYKICCGIPTGYSIVGESCTNVNQSIINSQTVTNNINFKLTQ
jgi:hypothetical protein